MTDTTIKLENLKNLVHNLNNSSNASRYAFVGNLKPDTNGNIDLENLSHTSYPEFNALKTLSPEFLNSARLNNKEYLNYAWRHVASVTGTCLLTGFLASSAFALLFNKRFFSKPLLFTLGNSLPIGLVGGLISIDTTPKAQKIIDNNPDLSTAFELKKKINSIPE